MTDIHTHLANALGATGEIIGGVEATQWSAPSTCEEWTVRELVEHLVGGCALTAAVLSGQDALARPGYAETTEAELLQAYQRASTDVIETLQRPGALEQTVRVGFGPVPGGVAVRLCLVEAIVHGWDIAQSTQQGAEFDEAAVAVALNFSGDMMSQIPVERSPFDPPQSIAPDAAPLHQLLALLGRSPVAKPR